MPTLRIAPPASPKSPDPFIQHIELVENEKPIAQAHWTTTDDPAQGIVQILELTVQPPHRRQGHAKRLMDALTQQAREHFKSRRQSLKRMWLTIDQKRQVIARSFLMKFGFHHVGTIKELLQDQDVLIYMRTFN